MEPVLSVADAIRPDAPIRPSPERQIAKILEDGTHTPKEIARLAALAIKGEITAFRIDESGTKPSEVRDLSTALANKCRAWQTLAQVVAMVEPKPERETDGREDDGWGEALGAKKPEADGYVPPPKKKTTKSGRR